jgi:hypothetical protein
MNIDWVTLQAVKGIGMRKHVPISMGTSALTHNPGGKHHLSVM